MLRSGRVALLLVAGLAGLVAAGWAVAEIGRLVTPGLALTEVDTDVTGYLAARRTPVLTGALVVVSWLGSLPFVAALVVVLGLVAGYRRRYWHWLWLPLLAGGGALAISGAVKVLSARDRPPLDIAVVDAFGAAFPSGHSIRAMAVYGALALLASRLLRGRGARVLLWTGTGVLVLAVGFSRIYLGAHWVTDVLAGFLLGGVWLVLVLVATGLHARGRAGPP